MMLKINDVLYNEDLMETVELEARCKGQTGVLIRMNRTLRVSRNRRRDEERDAELTPEVDVSINYFFSGEVAQALRNYFAQRNKHVDLKEYSEKSSTSAPAWEGVSPKELSKDTLRPKPSLPHDSTTSKSTTPKINLDAVRSGLLRSKS
jgi:hypothetical protein